MVIYAIVVIIYHIGIKSPNANKSLIGLPKTYCVPPPDEPPQGAAVDFNALTGCLTTYSVLNPVSSVHGGIDNSSIL